jgi:hypothetical protein
VTILGLDGAGHGLAQAGGRLGGFFPPSLEVEEGQGRRDREVREDDHADRLTDQ